MSLFVSSGQRNSYSFCNLVVGNSCTNFAASINDTVLFGNSEDTGGGHYLRKDPLSTRMFYYPEGADGGFGCVFVGWLQDGYSRSVQGGMNDQ